MVCTIPTPHLVVKVYKTIDLRLTRGDLYATFDPNDYVLISGSSDQIWLLWTISL